MFSEVKAAVDSVKVLADILKASKDMANYNEVASAISELNSKLFKATESALAGQAKISLLLDQVRLLEEEIVKRENWEGNSKNYTLQAVGFYKMHFVQVYKPLVQPSKVRHWACVKCFEERKVHILSANDRYSYECPNCKTEFKPVDSDGSLALIDSAYK